MNIKQIQSFVAVADAGSFSEAAEWMYTSVSQISKLVKAIEEDVGYVLFERKKNGVVLTSEGIKVYNIANKIIQDVDELELIKEKNGKKSFAVIGLPDVEMDNLFIEYMSGEDKKNYHFNFSNLSIEEMCRILHVRRADIGFAYFEKRRLTAVETRLAKYALDFTPLCNTRKYLFVNTRHPLAKEKQIEITKVEKTELIKITGRDFFKTDFMKCTFRNIYSQPQIRMQTSSLSTAINVLMRNNELAYIGSDVFNEYAERENICRIPIVEEEETTHFGYIMRNNIDMSEKTSEFIEFAKSKLNN